MPIDRGADAVEVLLPAGCADDHVDAEGGDRLDVADDGVRSREIDRDIDAVEVLGGDAFAVGVVEFVELQGDVEAVLGGKLFDQPPILP